MQTAQLSPELADAAFNHWLLDGHEEWRHIVRDHFLAMKRWNKAPYGYADLSDFFYVWLRQMLHRSYPDLLATLLVPKGQELVADPFRHGGRDEAKAFFEKGISRAFAVLRTATDEDFPATIYYAFKRYMVSGLTSGAVKA